jgi:predicted permease
LLNLHLGGFVVKILFLIVLNVIVPVFILIGAGVFLHRKFHFDLNTLSKLTTYLFIPTVSFVNIYENKISGNLLFEVIGFLALHNFCLIMISIAMSKMMKLDRRLAATFQNSMVLNNSGNFGIPVSQLLFHHHPLGLSIQIVVTIFQNFLTNTYGLFNSVSANHKGSAVIVQFFKFPVIYALLLGLLLHSFEVKIPSFIWKPIESVANAFLAVALLTLGAQVAYLKIARPSLLLLISIFGRLVLSPMIALIIIFILGIKGTVAQALFIASSYPASRNMALLALEHDNYPEYAAQAVLLSTLLSSITVTIVVYLSRILF